MRLGLGLGADTILVRMGETSSGAKILAVEADRERLLTLLGVSYGHRVPPSVVKNIENAAEHWRRGDKVWRISIFAFTGLPRLENTNDVYRLYLAESLLDDGFSPREMLTELGLDRTMRQIAKYDPNQPRAPAGSGSESGQWTKDESLASTSGDEDHRVQLAGDVIHVGFLVGRIIIWWTGGTNKLTGKVTKYGPSIDVGAMDPKELTDELIVPMGGLKVAIRLPEELQSADRLKIDFANGSFILVDP